MFKRLYFIILLLVLTFVKVNAQYDVSFSHYFDMEPSFNPGSVGKQAKLNVVAAYALDMAGFEHNPRTMYVGADMPFYFMKSYHGAGLQLISDQIGLFTHQRLSVQYAYKLGLFGGTLNAGLQVAQLYQSSGIFINGGKVVTGITEAATVAPNIIGDMSPSSVGASASIKYCPNVNLLAIPLRVPLSDLKDVQYLKLSFLSAI